MKDPSSGKSKEYIETFKIQMSCDESKRHDEKDIFEEYKSKYKLISTSELNKKIMSETTPFYYLSYIKQY